MLTGIELALNKKDSLITSYRDHCQHISRGGSVQEVMAELFGRATGATKGEERVRCQEQGMLDVSWRGPQAAGCRSSLWCDR